MDCTESKLMNMSRKLTIHFDCNIIKYATGGGKKNFRY